MTSAHEMTNQSTRTGNCLESDTPFEKNEDCMNSDFIVYMYQNIANFSGISIYDDESQLKLERMKIFCNKLDYRTYVDPSCRRHTSPYKDPILTSMRTYVESILHRVCIQLATLDSITKYAIHRSFLVCWYCR